MQVESLLVLLSNWSCHTRYRCWYQTGSWSLGSQPIDDWCHKPDRLPLLSPSMQRTFSTAERRHLLANTLVLAQATTNQIPVSGFTSTRQHPSYGECLEVKREYYQNCSVLGCVTQCSQSAAYSYEQFLQVQ